MEDEQDPPTLQQVQELQKMFPHGHGLAPMSWVTGSLHEIERLKKGHAYMVEEYKRDNDALREALYRIDHLVGGHLSADNPTDVLCSAVEDNVKAALDPYPVQTVAEPTVEDSPVSPAPLKAEGSFAFLESEPNLYDPKPAAAVPDHFPDAGKMVPDDPRWGLVAQLADVVASIWGRSDCIVGEAKAIAAKLRGGA